MLTQEDDVDIHALRRRGWSISAIARHVGKDRRTVRAYLDGKRQVGVRAPAGADTFAAYAAYCTARLAEDHTCVATALFDEVTDLGYDRSYPSFTRALRLPRCAAGCASRVIRRTAARSRIIGSPGWGGNSVGLGRTPGPAGGWDGLRQETFPVGRGAVSFQQVAWGVV